jgi:hypothetical protein
LLTIAFYYKFSLLSTLSNGSSFVVAKSDTGEAGTSLLSSRLLIVPLLSFIKGLTCPLLEEVRVLSFMDRDLSLYAFVFTIG